MKIKDNRIFLSEVAQPAPLPSKSNDGRQENVATPNLINRNLIN